VRGLDFAATSSCAIRETAARKHGLIVAIQIASIFHAAGQHGRAHVRISRGIFLGLILAPELREVRDDESVTAGSPQRPLPRRRRPTRFLDPTSRSRLITSPLSFVDLFTMPTFQTYNVTPILPETLEPLRELSFNSGGHGNRRPADCSGNSTRALDQTNHNPVRMLQLFAAIPP